ncbi:MAG: DUF5107 domain-containing protein [Kordiimonadaceae bacterium]|jgi:predicted Zn-dependent protease|nr:DUF5107 domain-containing protein [Kordiimonadaceae bacterium]MBT6033783.1 DUF5107 domain-containing protein [Kordiimonadaceae bacterium]
MSSSTKPLLQIITYTVLLLSTSMMASLAAPAQISEETRSLKTYPYNDPNPVPILTRDPRLYPYHSFEGYTNDPIDQNWKVIKLENDLIEVYVLPEAGGKVWGAVVKETGHEFIYRNEVMKFRNIALRGPWTSGGIEFNFGVIGHTPSTASAVDYTTRKNEDGSVSAIVGSMDLPSRTHWRVEIRLPADKAYFETNVLWSNPTTLEQPYYNWMTGAAFAQDDLEMSIPGKSSLTHPGEETPWPMDSENRNLAEYDKNQFDGHKSYHIVGEMNDFFGGYYKNEDYGFGHWSRHEEMPGQKLWLWALSREGGIWEDLLTDTDGQYIEFQAGRMLNQYQPGDHINPITKSSFPPGTADRWTETWFPLEGIGGLTDASREGAMYVHHQNGKLTVNINAFSNLQDTLSIYSGDQVIASMPLNLTALSPALHTFDLNDGAQYRVVLPALDLNYSSNAKERAITRPYSPDQSARAQIPAADVDAFEGRELLKARHYKPAQALFEKALASSPWHHDALLGLADLNYRSGEYQKALGLVTKLLQLDAYDADGNFMAGNIYRALGLTNNARDAFGWAARSMAYRSSANVQLSEIMMNMGNMSEANRYAELALDYDRYNASALQILAINARRANDEEARGKYHSALSAIDPLSHFLKAEHYLGSGTDVLTAASRSEYPDQILLELALDYHRRGADEDAVKILSMKSSNPLLRAWQAKISNDPSSLGEIEAPDFVFPYRRETLGLLKWATSQNDHWSWSYLYALNLWAVDREIEATSILTDLNNTPDFAPFYVVRSHLGNNSEQDLQRAASLAPDNRIILMNQIQYLQANNKWQDALDATQMAKSKHQDDFNLDLLMVKSLNNLGRADQAINIMANIYVLPSENARDSHMMYAQAHTIAAMDAMSDNDYTTAITHLNAAKQWPEHLGQGKPYNPEEQLQDYLLGLAKMKAGQTIDDSSGHAANKTYLESQAAAEDLSSQLIKRALSL